ncbi:Hus1-like protein [Backusella circina FSU 941]|nr:Hus1-like protein [Backusella circina FSU 941]
MRFRAEVNNPIGLYKLCQTLEKIGSDCIICFSPDYIRFIVYSEYGQAHSIQTWVKIVPQSLFSNYRVGSQEGNNINFEVSIEHFLRIARIGQQATDIRIALKSKNNCPCLEFNMTTDTVVGTTAPVTMHLFVKQVREEQLASIKEPTALNTPSAFICLPETTELKQSAERLKSLSKHLKLSVNLNGVMKIETDSDLCVCELEYSKLETPKLQGHPMEDRDKFASVRLLSDDFLHFLSCYHLNPSNVICAIIDEVQVAFYVYLNLEEYQTSGHSVLRQANNQLSIMTCRLPVYSI